MYRTSLKNFAPRDTVKCNSTKRPFGIYCVKHTMHSPLERQIYCCGRTFDISDIKRKNSPDHCIRASIRVRNSHPIIGNVLSGLFEPTFFKHTC